MVRLKKEFDATLILVLLWNKIILSIPHHLPAPWEFSFSVCPYIHMSTYEGACASIVCSPEGNTGYLAWRIGFLLSNVLRQVSHWMDSLAMWLRLVEQQSQSPLPSDSLAQGLKTDVAKEPVCWQFVMSFLIGWFGLFLMWVPGNRTLISILSQKALIKWSISLAPLLETSPKS